LKAVFAFDLKNSLDACDIASRFFLVYGTIKSAIEILFKGEEYF